MSNRFSASPLRALFIIITKGKGAGILKVLAAQGVNDCSVALGVGTAQSTMLDFFGLDGPEKEIIFSPVATQKTGEILAALSENSKLKKAGYGIAFTIPISSMGGKRALQFLTEDQDFHVGEETTLKDTKYELLVVIANQGYSSLVMDAARSENAGGGTVIHAKGTGMERAENFLGVSLAAEKEMVLIVVKREEKNRIMRAIMDQAGTASKARSIVFSLPVTSTAGLRLLEDDKVEDEA